MLIQDIIPPVRKAVKPIGKIIKKQSRNKYVSAILAFLLIFQTISGVFVPFNISIKSPSISLQEAKAAGENWFATGGTWSYRRAITLSPVTPAANYQVKVQLTAVNFDYTKMAFPATGADLRFTGSDGSTSQSYWIESWVNGGTSIIWVKVIASGESAIYMYYGNSGAAAATDGANTFNFFDDFLGSSLDASKWTVSSGSPAVGSGILTLNATNAWETVNGKTFLSVPLIIEARENFPAVGSSVRGSSGLMTSTSADFVMFDTVNTAQKVRGNYTSDISNTSSWTTGSYKIFKTVWTSTAVSFYEDGVQRTGSPITNSIYIPVADMAAYFDVYNATNSIDWVFIRSYAASEPAATVDAEEYFDHYAITGTATMDAGGSQIITITAKTNLGNTYNYSGDKDLTFSGPSVLGSNYPTCTNKVSADINFGTATTVTLASGVGACTMKLYKAESIAVDVTDGTITSMANATYDLDVAVSSLLSGMSIQINGTDSYTNSASTTLTLAATGASQMKFSNDNATYSAYEAYGVFKAWDITDIAYGGTSADGQKTVYVIFKDTYGNEGAATNDVIVYDATSPINPTAAVDAQGAVNDTWQNNKNDPNFTSFTGESDPQAPDLTNSGVASFYVYFGIDSAGVTVDSIVADAYDPAFFATSNIRYLRVITKDNASNWADPDGAGATCTNTNASRPADPDCWATIFIHKYDIDAPNTPSPASFPVSWTSTNSFNFSWVDPGDTGGSGVKDYTYQTNAGTGVTTAASISVNGLTSNADGTKLFSVKANDNAGNSGTDGTVNFYYDSTPPVNAGTVTDGNGSFDDAWGTVSDPNFTWGAGTDLGDQSGVKEYDVYWGIDPVGTIVTATVGTNAYNPAAIPANTPYYLRIKTRDNAGNESAWATKFTMKYSQAASTPSGLSQTANAASLAFGDWTSDTTPALNFTLADPDSDTLGYVIKIDNNSDFSSPEVFYTYSANDLVSGAEYSFTVGQAAGTGTYTNGIEGQTLAEGQYYWKVKAVESHGLASSEITANGGLAAFGIDASNPTGTTLGFGAMAVGSIIATVSGTSDAVSGLATSPYYFENTTAATNSGWQAGTSWSSASLTPNTQYTFKVTSRDKAGNGEATATQNKYTLANDPSAPTVDNATPTALDVNINVNLNPASTEFSVYKETGATCDGAGGSYIAADGSDNGATAVWKTDALWATTTITGLAESTQYSFCVKARNGDSTETGFGSAASGTTTVSNAAPNAPTLVSPANASSTSDTTPTLSANYSDSDAGDIGTTNYRISSTSLADCNNNLSIVAFGASYATVTNNEAASWTPGSSIGSDGTYYWCAQNNDGSLTSSWTSMGNFVLNTVPAPTPTPVSSGGGGLPPSAYSPPSSPSLGFSVLINNGDIYTNTRAVVVDFNGGPDAVNMAISEDPGFTFASQELYQKTKNLILSDGDGVKTVYVKFYTKWGQPSQIISDSIILDTKIPGKEIAPSPSSSPLPSLLPSPSRLPVVSPEILKIDTGREKPVLPKVKPPVEASPLPGSSITPQLPAEIGIPKSPEPAPSGSVVPGEPAKKIGRKLELPSVNFDFIKNPAVSAYRGIAGFAGGVFGGVKEISGKVLGLMAQGSRNVGKRIMEISSSGIKFFVKGAGSVFNLAKVAFGGILYAASTAAVGLFDNAVNTVAVFVGGIGSIGSDIENIIAEQFTPMQISNVKAAPVSPTSIEITWETNHRGTSKVNWGLSRVYDQEKQDSAKTKKHSVIITDLKPGTVYHYEVISQNGSYAYDADRIFYVPE